MTYYKDIPSKQGTKTVTHLTAAQLKDPKQSAKKEMTLWHRNAQNKRPEAIQCHEVTQQDWGFSFFVDSELEAYKAFYQYRNSKHGAIVEFAGGAGQWMVTVFNENGADLGLQGAKA
jgi:hypothetical protein